MRACLARGLIGLALTLTAWGCASSSGANIAAGQRLAAETAEAGLWMEMDRYEKKLETSGRRERDPQLNAYLDELVCRLSGDYCGDIRPYLIRRAGFNASMAPNGTMTVWTGLLLRTRDEAELAFVLGHEIGHYQRRHSAQRWEDARSKLDALVFVQAATALAGVGIAGNVAQIAIYGSIFAYSRDNEREADDIGFDTLVAQNYDADAAARVWERLIVEKNASDADSAPPFFASHPSSEERAATLRRKASTAMRPQEDDARQRFLAVTSAHWGDWLRDELRERDFDRMQVVLNHLRESGRGAAVIDFYQGELYRARADAGDMTKAVEAYRRALGAQNAPVEAWRSLGLALWREGRNADAHAAFAEYLRAAPDAEDRPMIESYLGDLAA